ncbi:MAG TPA: SpoIIE family protein phosphatase [Pirellulales bacterium]|nr:SpoIIE family protein phosphatase [Pirellulales bacterium]
MALLQALNGDNAGQRYLIAGDSTVIGRDPDCDVVLHVTAVSRRHARVFADSGTFFIEDLHSRNGTLLNGQPVVTPQRLAENDRLSVCEAMFSFHQQSSPTMLVDDEGDTVGAVKATVQIKAPRSSLHSAMVSAEAKLSAILEVSQSIGSTLAEDQVLNKILDSLFKIFLQAERGFVVLCEGADDALVIMAEKHRRPDDDVSAWLSRTLVSRAMASREAILSSDAANDPRFRQSEVSLSSALMRIRSVVCAPLVDSQGKALGVLQLDTLDQRTPFDQPDLELLATVARLAAIAIENARLYETAMKKQAIDHDLAIARNVQHRFLPKKAPECASYEFFHFYEAAEQLGGDYFDYIWLPGDRLAVVVADVSGKGIPAALLMARLAAETRYVLVGQADPAVAFDRLCAGWDEGFVTMTVAIVDPANHEVQFVNAGNLPPMLRHACGRVERLGEEHTCLPLGVSPDFRYESFKVPLAPGESVVMLTDGLSEAMNDENELYGLERLQDQLSRGAGTVAEIGNQLLSDIKGFVGERSQADDMCLVCFGRA